MKVQALVPLLVAGLLAVAVQHAAADGQTLQAQILDASTVSPNCGTKDQPCCSISAEGCQSGLVCTTYTREGSNPQAWYCRVCGGHEQPPCPGRQCKNGYQLASNDMSFLPLCVLSISDFNQQNLQQAEQNVANTVPAATVRVSTASAGADVASTAAAAAIRARVDMGAGAPFRACRSKEVWGDKANECEGDFVCVGKSASSVGTCYPPPS